MQKQKIIQACEMQWHPMLEVHNHGWNIPDSERDNFKFIQSMVYASIPDRITQHVPMVQNVTTIAQGKIGSVGRKDLVRIFPFENYPITTGYKYGTGGIPNYGGILRIQADGTDQIVQPLVMLLSNTVGVPRIPNIENILCQITVKPGDDLSVIIRPSKDILGALTSIGVQNVTVPEPNNFSYSLSFNSDGITHYTPSAFSAGPQSLYVVQQGFVNYRISWNAVPPWHVAGPWLFQAAERVDTNLWLTIMNHIANAYHTINPSNRPITG